MNRKGSDRALDAKDTNFSIGRTLFDPLTPLKSPNPS
jgi:hypothetical protein